jgi:hypothetical protein
MYTVKSGDTLQGIAQSAYGDSRRWYQIAEANHIASDSDLRVGQTLNLPNLVGGAHNGQNDFQPYDPSKMVGDTTPNLPQPPKKKRSWLASLVSIIVAVVLTVIGLGAIAVAVLSNLAGQAVGIATGAQDKFSWKSLGMSVVSAGVTQGLPAGDLLGTTAGTLANTVVRAGLANVITQGIGVATGLQDKFNWAGVAASAVGAGVGQAVGSAMAGDAMPFDGVGPARPAAFADMGVAGSVLRGGISAFAGGLTTAVMRGGKISVAQIAVDSFGNAIGSSLANANSSGSSTLPTGDFARADRAAYNDYVNTQQSIAQSDSIQARRLNEIDPRSDYGYRNGMDVASDNFNPATLGNYKNGMDIASDQAYTARRLREAQLRQEIARNASRSETRRELNRLAENSMMGTGAGLAPLNLSFTPTASTPQGSMTTYTTSTMPMTTAGAAYPEMRARVPTARETAVDWVSSKVGTSRAGNIVTGLVDGWLAAPDALSRVQAADALTVIPSVGLRLITGTGSYVGQLWDDPLGTVTGTMAGGVDGLRSGYRTLNSNDRAMGSALFTLGTAAIPLGRVESVAGFDFAQGVRLEGELYRLGRPATSLERTYEHALSPQLYAEDVAAHYGINLRGSGQKIGLIYDDALPAGQYGVTRAAEGGRVIRVGPDAMMDEATLANTIAHELSHARDYLRDGVHKPHGSSASFGDGSVYGSGNALEQWIKGVR